MSLISERRELLKKQYKVSEVFFNGTSAPFEYTLKLVIPGDPVSDGRPRRNSELNKFYNEKKEFLKKIFREIYKMDDILRKICIITPHKITIKTYSLPTKTDIKFMDMVDFGNEVILSIGKQDNDNIEKVNWDVLQDSEFLIILNDSYTVNNETIKYYSHKPRTEIYIDFNEDFKSKLYEHKITSSMEYKMYMCSKKYWVDMMGASDDKIVSELSERLINLNTKAIKKLNFVLKDYSANIIDGLFKKLFFKGLDSPLINIYISKRKKAEKLSFILKILTSPAKEQNKLLTEVHESIGDI